MVQDSSRQVVLVPPSELQAYLTEVQKNLTNLSSKLVIYEYEKFQSGMFHPSISLFDDKFDLPAPLPKEIRSGLISDEDVFCCLETQFGNLEKAINSYTDIFPNDVYPKIASLIPVVKQTKTHLAKVAKAVRIIKGSTCCLDPCKDLNFGKYLKEKIDDFYKNLKPKPKLNVTYTNPKKQEMNLKRVLLTFMIWKKINTALSTVEFVYTYFLRDF